MLVELILMPNLVNYYNIIYCLRLERYKDFRDFFIIKFTYGRTI